MYNVDHLIERVKTMAREHHQSPEVKYLFATRFTPASVVSLTLLYIWRFSP